jgi:hypothetical protein
MLASQAQGGEMASKTSRGDFVEMVAEEISSGIDRALQYWLGRIELEVVNCSLSTSERIYAVEQILQEYKDATGITPVGCASA